MSDLGDGDDIQVGELKDNQPENACAKWATETILTYIERLSYITDLLHHFVLSLFLREISDVICEHLKLDIWFKSKPGAPSSCRHP
jgi:hypothetical protein